MTAETGLVERQALALPDQARELVVETDEGFQYAGLFLRDCKAMRKKIDEFLGPIVKKTHEAHKEAVAKKRMAEEPVKEAEQITKTTIAVYTRKKEEERRKAEAEARRLAQELAEREALDRAAALEDIGRTEQAEAIIEAPIVPVAVVTPIAAPKAEGISVKKIWKFRVTDISRIDPKFLMADEKKIGQVVRSMKQDAASVVGDGIEVYYEDSVAARA